MLHVLPRDNEFVTLSTAKRVEIWNGSDKEDNPEHADRPASCMHAENTITGDAENDEIDGIMDGDGMEDHSHQNVNYNTIQ